MRLSKITTYLAPVLAAISISFFIAASGDRIHLFTDAGGEWRVVISTAFQSVLPLSLLLGVLTMGALWLLFSLWTGHIAQKSFREALALDAASWLPLAVGLIIPLRYLPGVASFSSGLFLLSSTLMGSALFLSVILCFYLKWRNVLQDGSDVLPRENVFSSMSDRTLGWSIFLLLLVIFWSFLPSFESRSVFGGDQPHYLIISHSLVEDGDIYIADDHEAGVWKKFTQIAIEPQYFERTTDGRIIPFHRIGLPILAALPYALAGKTGALLLIALLAALCAANTYWLVMKIVPHRGAALLATAWAALSVPVLPLSFMFYSEMVSALVTLISLNLIIRKDPDAPPRFLWLLPFIIWTLPWMHARDMVTAVALTLMLVVRMRKKPLVATGLTVLSLVLFMGIPLFNFHFYGTLSPVAEMGGDQGFAFSFENVIRGIGGLLFDQEFGLLLYNPLVVLALVGLVPLLRRSASITMWLIVVIGFSVGPNILYRMWWGGGSPPGRYYVAIFHLAAVPMAALLADARWKRWRPAFLIALVCCFALAVTLLVNPNLLGNLRDGSALMLTAVSAGAIDAVEWWPSWFGPTVQAWPLSAILTLWCAATLALLWFIGSRLSKKFTTGAMPRSTGATLGFALVLLSAIGYTGIAEIVTPGEPNDHQPLSHNLDLVYQQRYRAGGFSFIDVGGDTKEIAFPSRRFSAELLYSTEALTEDPKAARNRSLLLGDGKGEIRLNPEQPFWAGHYRLTLGLRSEAGNDRALVELFDQSELTSDSPAVVKEFDLTDEYRELNLPFTLPGNSAALLVRLSSGQTLRFSYALVQPLSLVKKADSHLPEHLSDMAAWRYDGYTLYADSGTIHSPEREGFWTIGDSEAAVALVINKSVASVELELRSRNGIAAELQSGSLHERLQFSAKERVKTITLTPQADPATGLRLVDFRVKTTGFFVPAQNNPKSDDQRKLGVYIRIMLR